MTLPREALVALGAKPGDEVEVRAVGPGRIVIELRVMRPERAA